MKQRVSESTWAEIRTAYASGLGLRELARNIGIPAGTVLARSKREGWSAQIRNAKTLATRPAEPPGTTPTEAAAMSIQERGERHISRVAGLTENLLTTFERLPEAEQLHIVDKLDTVDKIGRRTYGLNDAPSTNIQVVNLLTVSGAAML